MRFTDLASLGLVLALASPAAASEKPALTPVSQPAECSCRAQGRSFEVGETACLRVGESSRVAQCGMVLNNTSWRFTDQPCPES